jgi:hypothetical protein
MSLQDVTWLIQLEHMRKRSAASWHLKSLWEALRERVSSDEEALLLSKCLRTNQHIFLTALSTVVDAGAGGAIVPLLNLKPAEFRIEVRPTVLEQFLESHIVHLTEGDYTRVPRQTSYSNSLKSRLMRISFDSLFAYSRKARRNVRLDEAAALGGLDLDSELTALAATATSHRDDDLAAFDEALSEADPDKREFAMWAHINEGAFIGSEQRVIIDEIKRLQSRTSEALVRVYTERQPIVSDSE